MTPGCGWGLFGSLVVWLGGVGGGVECNYERYES